MPEGLVFLYVFIEMCANVHMCECKTDKMRMLGKYTKHCLIILILLKN